MKATHEADGLGKIPGANITHSFLGVILYTVAQFDDMKKEKLKDMIKIDLINKPHIDIVGPIGKVVHIIPSLAQWIAGYVTGLLAIPDIQAPIEKIQSDVVEVAQKIPEEFSNLSGMDLIKMTSSVNKVVSSIKKTCEAIISEMKAFTKAFE